MGRITRIAGAAGGLLVLTLAAGPILAASGQALFMERCSACHQADGSGTVGMAPSLRSGALKKLDKQAPTYVVGVILNGMSGVKLDGASYAGAMPPWSDLSDADVSALGSFVLRKLNGTRTGVTARAAAEVRKQQLGLPELKALRGAP
ncbi:MAG: cytochrome c [Steroidobacteraceae bacterium]